LSITHEIAQDAAFALVSEAQLCLNEETKNDNRIYYTQVWYRLFRYTHGEHYGESQIRLGAGYFIDLYTGTIAGHLWALQRLQNRSPKIEKTLAKLRFYQRWFEPVVQLLVISWIPSLRRFYRQAAERGRNNAPPKQTSRPVHPSPPTSNQCDTHYRDFTQ
jgi:hypothetical protein